MGGSKMKTNNKGFSLIELVVVVAIMALMVGVMSLSMSLLFGTEAHSAAEKISAQLSEVKTGSMSRYSEDVTVTYVSDPSVYDWADKEGYYVIKQMKTLVMDPTGKSNPSDATLVGSPKETALGMEHRYICNDKVSMVFTYNDGSDDVDVDILADGATGFTIEYDRSTGLFKNIAYNSTVQADGSASGTLVTGGYPVTLEVKSGVKTYYIDFIKETGKQTVRQ